MAAMVLVENLTKYYGNYIGIENVSFTVERGEVIGFLGPNGAGKTTTMRILTCSMPPTYGRAEIGGFDVMRESIEVRRRVGYLPETPPLYPEMTVEAYLRFVAEIKGVPRRSIRSRLDEVLHACALGHMRRRIVGHLSKGYRQRVGIAQALIHNPEVMIFDEPTSGLDPGQIIEIRELIRKLGRERTVILSTHILPEAQMTCRRLLIINQGRLVGDVVLDDEGRVETVETPSGGAVEYGTTRTIRAVVRGEGLDPVDRLRALPGIESLEEERGEEGRIWTVKTSIDVDLRSEIARTIVAAGLDLVELGEVRPSLEQVFLDLTHRDVSLSEEETTAEPIAS